MVRKLNIEGMSCEHCARAVKKALESVEGVKAVTVDLANRSAEFDSDHSDLGPMIEAVAEEGFVARVA